MMTMYDLISPTTVVFRTHMCFSILHYKARPTLLTHSFRRR
jgi:hypothetical protein